MSLITKQIIINKFNLPMEVVNIIKDYAFHKIKKIPSNDERYNALLTIPFKEYDPMDDTHYVYLSINNDKYYFLINTSYKIEIQKLFYDDDNIVYVMECFIFPIKYNGRLK